MSDAGRLINTDGPRLGHIPAFDGFRGLFVLQVVLYHALVTDFLEGSPIIIDWFFVASGFLITSLLLDERRSTGNNDLRRFYQRRALRLFPAMYLMIAVSTVILIIAVNFVPAARRATRLMVDRAPGGGDVLLLHRRSVHAGHARRRARTHLEPDRRGAVLLRLADRVPARHASPPAQFGHEAAGRGRPVHRGGDGDPGDLPGRHRGAHPRRRGLQRRG